MRKLSQRYLDEFDFRWNRRKLTDDERMVSAILGSEGKRLQYRLPVGYYQPYGDLPEPR